MNPIPLTLVERWTLANQFRILAKLDRAQSEDFTRYAEALERGHEYEYENCSPPRIDPITFDVGFEVMEVLQLFGVLLESYKALGDKSGLAGVAVTFNGFCPMDDHGLEMQEYADWIASAPSLYPSSPPSSTPVLARYRGMVTQWGAFDYPDTLEREAIIAIVKAGADAENRRRAEEDASRATFYGSQPSPT